MALSIKVKGFDEGGEIPKAFTCDGENKSPEISFSNIPPGTKSLALIVEDPDAPSGLFVHWVLFNIPPSFTVIEQGFTRDKKTKDGLEQGRNDFGRTGYDGPCPPRGHGYHRYFFRLYALSAILKSSEGETRDRLLKSMEGKILDRAETMGKYRR